MIFFKVGLLRQALVVLFVISYIFPVVARDIEIIEGEETGLEITLNTYNKLQLTNTLDRIKAFKVTTTQGLFTELAVPGYSNTYLVGSPKLPVNRKLIEIPFGSIPEVNIIRTEYEEFKLSDLGIDYPLIPAQPPAPKDGSYVPFEYDEKAYNGNTFTNHELVDVETLGIMRGLRIARVDISPVQYNPVSGKIRVYSAIEAEVIFKNADVSATLYEKQKNLTPYYRSAGQGLINYKHENLSSRDTMAQYPIKYVIVSDPMFELQLQPFIDWKTKKGFTVVEAYTDDPQVGNTTNSIKAYLQSLYDAGTAADPAPSFVLFVGDIAQIPAWGGNASWHVTDLLYVEYTGDYFPEVYYGRWSATNAAELQPQIDKTLQYEQYTMPDPAYLDEVVLIAGMDASHGNDWGNGQINYGTENYFNLAHGLTAHTYLYPTSGSHSVDIIQHISDGVSFGNYTAHCSANGWADPSFSISDISGLQNQDEYCVLIGNCCSSNEFNNYCFGEAILRAENKGAVGYIGGTNSTYWDEDYYFGVGVGVISEDPPSYEETGLGNYDRSFHDHGEPWEDWYTTTYQLIFAGNLAVTEGSPSMAEYYWEIYSVMGDPSLECYYGVPDPMTVTHDQLMPIGATSFTVNADPYAYVAISMDGVLYGANLADENGIAEVILSPIQIPGDADIVVTKQNMQPYIGTVAVSNPAGPYVVLSNYVINDPDGNNNALADYGETIYLDIDLENLGGAEAVDVEAKLSTNDGYVTITDSIAQWGSIASGTVSSLLSAFNFDVDDIIPDQHLVSFELEISDAGKEIWMSFFSISLQAPFLETGTATVDDSQGGNGNQQLDPGEMVDIVIPLMNNGHADALETTAGLSCSNTDILINTAMNNVGTLPYGDTALTVFSISVGDNIASGTSVPFEFIAAAGGYSDTLSFFLVVGQIPVLVVDFDLNNSSGPELMNCLDNLNIGADYMTDMPENLELYSSVFLCLGIYNLNYELSMDEGQALADYLATGGNLYMEGGDTWYYDDQTAVHPLFGITAMSDGSDDLSNLAGKEGTFTDQMMYTYSGENNWIDKIVPNGDAFMIFENEEPVYGTAVANIGPTYRTIGTSHEFGGLDDDEYTRDYLMFKYLQFFGIDAVWVGLDDTDLTNNELQLYPNPVRNNGTIILTLQETARMDLAIYSSMGELVMILASEADYGPGTHQFTFNSAGLAGGIYYCVASSNKIKTSKKLVVIK